MLRPLRDYVAFDFETTGLERDADEIVEIGAVRVVGGVLGERFSRLVKAQKALSPLVESLTGITPDILAEAVDPGPALQEFLAFAGGLPLVAHNSDFDAAFLQEALRRLSLPPAENEIFDSLLAARMAWPTFASHRLEDLAKALAMPPDRAHRALPDAERSALLWNLAMEKIAGYSPATLDDLARVLAPGPAHWRGLFDPDPASAELYPPAGRAAAGASTSPQSPTADAPPVPGITSPGDDNPFAPGGAMSRAFAAAGRPFRNRAGQARLASLAERALQEDCFLAVEADPGTGRTLACLTAAARKAMAGRRPVCYAAAGTRQLDRLVTSEFPILEALLGGGLKLASLKPPAAYLSPRKYADILRDPGTRLSDAERLALLPLVTWNEGTRTGDIGENMGFNHERQKVLWSKLGADSYAPEAGGPTWAAIARERAGAAHVLAVTHDLLLDDVALDFALLPPYEAVVWDDAHRLAEAAQERFGREVGFFRLRHALQLLAHSKTEDKGLLAALEKAAGAAAEPAADGGAGSLPAAFRDDLARLREKVHEPEKQLQKFFNKVGKHAQKRRKDGENRIRFADKMAVEFNAGPEAVTAALSEVEALLASLDTALREGPPEGRSLALDLRKAAGLLRDFRTDLDHLASPSGTGEVHWIEEFANPHRALIRCAPRDPGAVLAERFHPQMAAAVYVSSSLALGDQLGFFCRQAGLEPAHAGKVRSAAVRGQGASRQVAPLLLARFSPVLSGAKAMDAMSDLMARAIRALGRPAFLLFTHVGLLKQARERLGGELAKDGRLTAAQHVDGSRDSLLHLFRHRKDAVLLGTDAFVEGLGEGDTVPEVVAVTKLPFPVPSDPLVAAALERIQEEGGNPLYDFLLPTAILRLKQELGRLPRPAGGRVALWILDPRLCTEKYARAFLRGLGREAVTCASEPELLERTAEVLSGGAGAVSANGEAGSAAAEEEAAPEEEASAAAAPDAADESPGAPVAAVDEPPADVAPR